MARFLIASWDGGGNTPPAYHLASSHVCPALKMLAARRAGIFAISNGRASGYPRHRCRAEIAAADDWPPTAAG